MQVHERIADCCVDKMPMSKYYDGPMIDMDKKQQIKHLTVFNRCFLGTHTPIMAIKSL